MQNLGPPTDSLDSSFCQSAFLKTFLQGLPISNVFQAIWGAMLYWGRILPFFLPVPLMLWNIGVHIKDILWVCTLYLSSRC